MAEFSVLHSSCPKKRKEISILNVDEDFVIIFFQNYSFSLKIYNIKLKHNTNTRKNIMK